MLNFRVSSKLNLFFIVLVFVGLVSAASSYYFDVERSLALLVVAAFFLLSITLFGSFFVALQLVSGAKWSTAFRRVSESYVYLFFVVFILLGLIIFQMGHIYHHWVHASPDDAILAAKSFYLNQPFFIARVISFSFILFIVSFFLRRSSILQDENPSDASRGVLMKCSIVFLICFAYLFAGLSIDLVMSLEPHWYTSMFVIYTFAALLYTGFASLIFLVLLIKKNGGLKKVNYEHIHDLGKFQFGFISFWAYIGFSQFMLIWYANIPEETLYLERRFVGNGKEVMAGLWILHFVIPFIVLLSRSIKRNYKAMFYISLYLMFVGFLDIIWLVYPALDIHGLLVSHYEIGVFIGLLGLISLFVLNTFSKKNEMPIGDSTLQASIDLHQKY